MTDDDKQETQMSAKTIWNLPNQLTVARLILSVILFVFIAYEFYFVAFWLFIIAAGTDWLDGYFARKYNMITKLGRVLDPFADKIIICGTFIFVAATPGMMASPYGLKAWMVVVVVGRELLVTMLRSHIEGSGGDFSAKMSGKLKMVAQCVVGPAALLSLSYPPTAEAMAKGIMTPAAPLWVSIILITSIWLTLLSTVYSGGMYVVRAIEIGRAAGKTEEE